MPKSLKFSRSLRSRRALAALAMLAPLGLNTGCVGKFPLTKATYRFNITCSPNEFVQTLVFWGFNILPIYGGAILIDTFVLNMIEFWSGETIDLGPKNHAAAPAGAGVNEQIAADEAIRLTGLDAAGREVVITLAPSAPGVYVAMADDGRELGRIKRDDNGDALLYAPDGRLLKRLPGIATR